MPINGRLSNVINAADLQREINELKAEQEIYLHNIRLTYGQLNIFNNSPEKFSNLNLYDLLFNAGCRNIENAYAHDGKWLEGSALCVSGGIYADETNRGTLKEVYYKIDQNADTKELIISGVPGVQIVIDDIVIKM